MSKTPLLEDYATIPNGSSNIQFEVFPNPIDEGNIVLRITTNAKSKLTLFITNIFGIEVKRIELGTFERGTYDEKL